MGDFFALLFVSIFSGTGKYLLPPLKSSITSLLSNRGKEKIPLKNKRLPKKQPAKNAFLIAVPDKFIDNRRLFAIFSLDTIDLSIFIVNLIFYFAKKRHDSSVELEFLLAREDCPEENKVSLSIIIKSFVKGLEEFIKVEAKNLKKTKKTRIEHSFKIDKSLATKVKELDKKFTEDKLFRNLIEISVNRCFKNNVLTKNQTGGLKCR